MVIICLIQSLYPSFVIQYQAFNLVVDALVSPLMIGQKPTQHGTAVSPIHILCEHDVYDDIKYKVKKNK